MYSKVNYTIVGLFVVLFSIGMAWFAFWLAKYGLEEDYYTYKVEMKESIAGLSKDSNVKLHGVDVGRVSAIRINPENIESIEILLEIRKEIPIKEDMKASTQMLGVTGLLSIEIDGGTNNAKTLEPTAEYIPLIPSKTSLLSTLTTNLSSMSEKLDKVLSQSQKLLSNKNIDTFGKILMNAEKVTQKTEQLEEKAILTLDALKISIHEARQNFTKVTKDFKKIQLDFAEIKGVTVPMVNKVMQTSKNFNRVTLKMEKTLDRGDYNVKKIFEPFLVDIGIVSEQMNDLVKELQQNPSGVLFKSRKHRKGPGE